LNVAPSAARAGTAAAALAACNAAPPAPLIDCHVHLQEAVFAPDLGDVLGRAAEAGVRRLVCNGTREDDWPSVLRIARASPGVVPCFGLHPWYVAGRSPDWLPKLECLLQTVPSGVGEVGLDRRADGRDEAAQEALFRAQLALGRRFHRPVMIHCVRAWGWFLDVLRDEAPLPAGMLLHAYSGSAELLGELLERGAYFSFAGSVLAAGRRRTQGALQQVPLDRLLIETDAPALPPPATGHPGSAGSVGGSDRDEPANLPALLRGIAELRGMTQARLSQSVWENACRFFGVADINPDCRVEALQEFVHVETLERVLAGPPEVVIDAIDSFSPKVALLAAAAARGIPLVSSMGAALRTDPSCVRVGPLRETTQCPLAKRVRKRLRPLGASLDFPCVYSVEPVLPERSQGAEADDTGEEEHYLRGRERRPFGSLPTLTGIFGLTAANEVLRTLLGERFPA